MLIGKDFDKIEFNLFGLDLLEPNAFVGDMLIASLSLFFAFKTFRYFREKPTPFFFNWMIFFFVFAFCFLMGGLGHLLFNYTGYMGKVPGWIAGIIAPYFIVRAMISLLNKVQEKKHVIVFNIFIASLILLQLYLISFIDLTNKPLLGLIPSMVSSLVCLIYSLGILGYRLSKSISPSLKYLWVSTLVLAPTIPFQVFKINPYPLFDRNDISHICLIVNTILYFIAVKGFFSSKTSNESVETA